MFRATVAVIAMVTKIKKIGTTRYTDLIRVIIMMKRRLTSGLTEIIKKRRMTW